MLALTRLRIQLEVVKLEIDTYILRKQRDYTKDNLWSEIMQSECKM